MPNDQLFRLSWKAGELFVHGTSEKYLRHVVTEYLLASERIKVEPARKSDGQEETGKEKGTE